MLTVVVALFCTESLLVSFAAPVTSIDAHWSAKSTAARNSLPPLNRQKAKPLSASQAFRTTEIFYACGHQTIDLAVRDLFVF